MPIFWITDIDCIENTSPSKKKNKKKIFQEKMVVNGKALATRIIYPLSEKSNY